MTDATPFKCGCCKLEKSDLRAYPDMGIMLCPYCELLPVSVISQAQHEPAHDSLFTAMARLLSRLEQRVLQQDPELPLRTPIHDKALALIMQLGVAKLCPRCGYINKCMCDANEQASEPVLPAFWPYTDAREILAAAAKITSTTGA